MNSNRNNTKIYPNLTIKHKKYNVHGLQFHPESILTENGKTILTNWINHVNLI